MAKHDGLGDRDEQPDSGRTPQTAPAGPPRDRPVYRAFRLVAGLALGALGLWVGVEAFGYGGAGLAPPVLFAAGAALVVAAVLLIIRGLLRPAELEEQTQLAKRAGHLGLPPEPAAYQDGGLAVAATATLPVEAELIAQELNARGIPAWVDQSNAAVTLSHLQFAINPEGVRVLVPLGRLPDAQAALALLHAEEAPAADPDSLGEKEEENAEVTAWALRRHAMVVGLMGAGALVFSVPLLCYAIWLTIAVRQAMRMSGESPVLKSALRWALISIALCITGIGVTAGILVVMARR